MKTTTKHILQLGVAALALSGVTGLQAGSQAGSKCHKCVDGDVSTYVETSKGPRLTTANRDGKVYRSYAYDTRDGRYIQHRSWDRNESSYDTYRNSNTDPAWRSKQSKEGS
jgi:hypothetical protein